MSNELQSALVIQLQEAIKWSAALPPIGSAGTLTKIDPGSVFDVTQYARRDREFQHRDMVNAAAVAKVSLHATTVWSGQVVKPIIEGTTGIQDSMPVDKNEVRYPLPINSTAVTYVLNADVPFASINVTDRDLYSRDLMLYETLARASALFPATPISEIDPGQTLVTPTVIWATATGTNTPRVPNSALPLDRPLFRDADTYLAERDNQIAAYVSRICRAIKNPFDFASRIYVQVGGPDAREPETYVLTDNVFVSGSVYASGEQVFRLGVWYQAINTTGDEPPSSNWQTISSPTKRLFLAEPSLDSRNRIVYDTSSRTLQWSRETLDLVQVPQIVGLSIPGLLPGQTISTVPVVPEQKDAQFYRKKTEHLVLSDGTWNDCGLIVNDRSSVGTITGSSYSLFQNGTTPTLMVPGTLTAHFNITVDPGTYLFNCLVRPSSVVEIAGKANTQHLTNSVDEGVDLPPTVPVTWQIPLPPGVWQLSLEFSNAGTTPVQAFPTTITQAITGNGNTSVTVLNSFPLNYTDDNGNPFGQFAVVEGQPASILSSGATYDFTVTWDSQPVGTEQLRVNRLKLSNPTLNTGHYVMQAVWADAIAIGRAGTAVLNVFGQPQMPDVMPFSFNVINAGTAANVVLNWFPASAPAWQPKVYIPGDEVFYSNTYWEAGPLGATELDVPGAAAVWSEVATEPQLPILFEQVQIEKFTTGTLTPMSEGFEGFRQDMMERALRADQDAYSRALTQSGTDLPEFRQFGSIWDIYSTGSWMSYLETQVPRLREIISVDSIIPGHQYEAIGSPSHLIVYNSGTYHSGDTFYGVAAAGTWTHTGTATVNQVGAYSLAKPGDIGKTGLIPAGLEFNQSAGTVIGWYPSYASYPTHQAIQPWMIEQQFYVAFESGNSNRGPRPLVVPQSR